MQLTWTSAMKLRTRPASSVRRWTPTCAENRSCAQLGRDDAMSNRPARVQEMEQQASVLEHDYDERAEHVHVALGRCLGGATHGHRSSPWLRGLVVVEDADVHRDASCVTPLGSRSPTRPPSGCQ